MPMDKATQLSLGLNHGLPAWYKRAQTVQIRPEPQVTATSPSSRLTGPWRRLDSVAAQTTGRSVVHGALQSSGG
jgi:hypothetical protein